MEISVGPLTITITMADATSPHKRWEELVAVGMDDLELARLNQANTRDPVLAPWEGLAQLIRGGRQR